VTTGLHANRAIAIVALVAAFAILIVHMRSTAAAFGEPALLSGYLLYAIFVALALFNVRKRLSMVPLGRASLWATLHVYGGLFAIALYWLHARSVWPNGLYEQLLAVLVYLVSATGLVGYVIQNIFPNRLTQTGIEVVFERIPAEIARLREEAEDIVLECTRELQSDTLSRHYFETFAWYFARPRFILNHLFGSQHGLHWVRQQRQIVGRYLQQRELDYLDRLIELGYTKTRVDVHYVLQSAMKRWLLLHVPLSAALLALATWHLILVHVYAL
jgi:hypothetical protein